MIESENVIESNEDRSRIPIPSALLKYKISNLPDSFYYIADFLTEEEERDLLNEVAKNRWHKLSHRRLQSHPTALSSNGTLLLDIGTSTSPLPTFLQPPLVKTFDHLHNDSSEPNLSSPTSISSASSSPTTTPIMPAFFTCTKHKTPNHVLINEYPPGIGITPHEDGPAYAPVVATVSLGSEVVLDVYPKEKRDNEEDKEDEKAGGIRDNISEGRRRGRHSRLLLEPRSLFVTTEDAYTSCLHGIQDVKVDEGLGMDTVANWSLTVRGSNGENEDEKGSGSRAHRNARTETRVSLTYRDVLKVKDVGKMIFGKGMKLGKR